MRLPALALCLALTVPALDASAATRPQVVDPSGDALFAPRSTSTVTPVDVPPLPAGSQPWGDVLSVTWTALHKGPRFSGFTVAMRLSAPPVPPSGVVATYRVYGTIKGRDGATLGLVWNTGPGADGTAPTRTHLRDTLTRVTRRTYLADAVVRGTTVTWTVPAAVIPPGIGAGDVLTDLHAESRICQTLQGQTVPAEVPLYGGYTTFATTSVDDAYSSSSFALR